MKKLPPLLYRTFSSCAENILCGANYITYNIVNINKYFVEFFLFIILFSQNLLQLMFVFIWTALSHVDKDSCISMWTAVLKLFSNNDTTVMRVTASSHTYNYI